jgi:hypothetical protein
VAAFAAAPTLAGWALGVAVTAVILGTPYLLFAYHSPELHLVLDSLDTSVALLVAYLLYGRSKRSRHLQDLLLADGLLLLAVAGVGMTLGLHLLGFDDGRSDVWLPCSLLRWRVTDCSVPPVADRSRSCRGPLSRSVWHSRGWPGTSCPPRWRRHHQRRLNGR